MPIDNEKIKKALDDFENDDFISAKDTIKKEIKSAVNDFYKEKLELNKDLEPNTDTEKKETDVDAGEGGSED